MNPRSNVSMLVVVLALLWSCAGSGSASGARPGPARSSDLVTSEELSRAGNSPNLFEALQRIRPNWFRLLPTSLEGSSGDVVIYLDGSRMGGPQSLRSIAVSSVSSVRHYDATEAQARFGLGHPQGAIEVVTLR